MCCGNANLGKGGNGEAETKQGICDVHRLVDEDIGIRKVIYCGVCNAWLCDECVPKLYKRGYAALISSLSNLF